MSGSIHPNDKDRRGAPAGRVASPEDTVVLNLSEIGMSSEQEALRGIPALASTSHLTLQQEIQRNLSFIDHRHQDAAAKFVSDTLHIESPAEQLQHLHKYYLKEFNKREGCFETAAWDNFNRAANYIDGLIEGNPGPHKKFSGLPDVQVILTVNALLQHGKLPDNLTTMIRDSYAVMGIDRDKADVLSSFDEHGQYRARLFEAPPMLGFCTWSQFRVHRNGNSVIGLLQELNYERPKGERKEEIGRELEARTSRNPHEVGRILDAMLHQSLVKKYGTDQARIEQGENDPNEFSTYKRIQIISAMGRLVLGRHLNAVCNQYQEHATKIVDKFGSKEALSTPEAQQLFQKSVIRLGTNFGSVIDMAHFAMDGMGRTNLQLERLVMGQFGLQRPAPIGVEHNGKFYENGTYVFPKDVRVEAIFAKLGPLDVEKSLSAMAVLKASLQADKGRRLQLNGGA
jgi:hypothetical protein